MASQTPTDLVNSFEALCKELPKRLNGDAEEEVLRTRALDLADNVTKALRSPLEHVQTSGLGHLEAAGILIAADLDLFNTIANHQGPMKIQDIAASTKGDETLVVRIVRFLVAHGLVDQINATTYVANRMTQEYTHDYYVCLIRTFSFCAPSFWAAPGFLRKTNHQNPANPIDCAWQVGFATKDSFWEWLRTHPEEASYFNRMLTVPRSRFPDRLVECYPFEKLFAGSTAADVLFVDVGGGLGQQCINLRQSFGIERGRILLQDLPEVVKSREIEGVEVMAHDMMQSQPIAGARAYYFRGVCHDHNNEVCKKFLGQIKKAMTEKSRLLVHEEYVADINPSMQVTRMDVCMMSLFSAMERSESQMEQLLELVGFKVIGQHSSGKSSWKIIEASL